MGLSEKHFDNLMFEPNTGCWMWVGLTAHEYGSMYHEGRTQRAHRVFYTAYKGPIPDGLVIDHLCRNKCCVNPEHLEAVTQKENVRRGKRVALLEERKFCLKGHALVGDNVIIRRRKYRYCRICHYAENVRYKIRVGILKPRA